MSTTPPQAPIVKSFAEYVSDEVERCRVCETYAHVPRAADDPSLNLPVALRVSGDDLFVLKKYPPIPKHVVVRVVDEFPLVDSHFADRISGYNPSPITVAEFLAARAVARVAEQAEDRPVSEVVIAFNGTEAQMRIL